MATDRKIIEEIRAAEEFIDHKYLDHLEEFDISELNEYEKNYRFVRLFAVLKIMYDREENTADKLTNVFHSLFPFCDYLILFLKGMPDGVELYLGVVSRRNAVLTGELLKDAFLGNFPGSVLTSVKESEVGELFAAPGERKGERGEECPWNIAAVNVIPALRGEKKEGFVQGLEKFIDTMKGSEYLCEILASPLPEEEMEERAAGFEELYSALFPFSKKTMTHGYNEGTTLTEGINKSIADSIGNGISRALGSSSQFSTGVQSGTNVGMHMLLNFGFNRGTSESRSTGNSYSETDSETRSRQNSSGWNRSEAHSRGTMDSLTVEYAQKGIQELLEKINRQLKRFREGKAYGMWECAAFFAGERKATAAMAASTFRSLMLGDSSGDESSRFFFWGKEREKTKDIWEALRYFRHPRFLLPFPEQEENRRGTAALACYLNGRELPLFLGLPRKSVGGLIVDHMAEFGRNVTVRQNDIGDKKGIRLGKVFHMGREERTQVELDLESLTGHCFITGSTGSGKSNTVYRLIEKISIEEGKIPFLVIEPAKGEYRNEFRKVEGIHLFTTSVGLDQLLKINPFSFEENIHILEHMDRLIEIFNTCWEMYAAMPAILKEAVENAYRATGWDLLNSLYVGSGERCFPTFGDVLEQLPKIINRSEYSSETKGDYIGALVTRVRSLTNGIYGQIFCDSFEVEAETLFEQNTVIDLSRVGSSETKALLMGILILKLSEHRMAHAAGGNEKIRHLTVLEEAHHILKNTEKISTTAGNSVVAKSVEMIVNSIAEMRTYGEGFLIVDQSPTSVDIAAIKNTNTKIVMRLPEKEDCRLAGYAISLKDSQLEELTRLQTGVAAVMQNQWQQAVLCKVDSASHKYMKYEGQTPFQRRKAFKSAVITELLNQFVFTDRQQVERIDETIENFPIGKSAKEEMSRMIGALCELLKREFDSVFLGRSLLSVTGCREMLAAAEQDLALGQDGKIERTSLEAWKSQIYRMLEQYVTVKEEYKQALLQYILHAKRYEAGDLNYDVLYREVYETKGERGR